MTETKYNITQLDVLIVTSDDFENRGQTSIHDYVVSHLKKEAHDAYKRAALVILRHGWDKILKTNTNVR
jgi:hypothetical protein